MTPLVERLRTSSRVVLSSHINPDGDAIGSEVALAATLSRMGKEAVIINCSPTPFVYDFLDPDRRIHHYAPERDDALIATADAILVVDTNHPGRLDSMERAVMASKAWKGCIDHHLDPAPFASEWLIDSEATSTGEIMVGLISTLVAGADPLFTPKIATALYCAIMTDTGNFRYPRVDADLHRITASLIEAGADPVAIYSLVYERWSGGRVHLLGEMLADLRLESSGRLAHVAISRDMLARTGTSEEDTDNFTTYPMSVNGVVVGILLLELPGGVKISFRSRGDIPINELARIFGGNGHKNAAGARLSGISLAEARSRVVSSALTFLPTLSTGTA